MKETFTTMEVFILYNAGQAPSWSTCFKVINENMDEYLKAYTRLLKSGYIDPRLNLTQKGVNLCHKWENS